ncbi:PstA family ABC transporter permease [Desulfurococcus amylolyticus]|uniref:Phosphate ABC transporter membrane protein 2, PhoT family n=1 Tax=Desulfurococcus amylolyticus DSM 16532 TaxID=768672 RepID=I3XQ54_DESAM|nr:ABC transporter permease subunit [Desulfurococcus amylolyticus]AFL66078.1 phosphate ABC transporter membrane protein 2, PhoT family [Desulfurococcus amylolyticus DSM 16532]
MARDARKVINMLVILVIIFLSGLGVLPLLWLLYSTVLNGLPPLIMKGLSFITGLPGTPMGTDIGGIAPALVGTLISSTIATLMAVALAVFSSMFTREYPYSLVSGFIETVIRAFNGIPTIIISMFIYSIMVIRMGRPSILAGSLALFIAVLPTAHYYLSSAFRSVEEKYREAAFSLGFKRVHLLRYVYLGIARRQVASGILMTFIRSAGETAPLLFTIGFLTNSVFQGIDQPGNAVSLLIFNYALSPYNNYHMAAWGASLLLLLLILVPVLFIEWFVKEVRK